MSIRDDFFAAQAKASLWDVAVSIKRGNPLPLDANAVYASYGVLVSTEVVDGVEKNTYTPGSLLEYAKTNPVAYPGQICAVVDVNKTTIYYLDQNLEIQPVGIIPTGDNKTIEVTESGAISLFGAANAPTGTLPMIDEETGKIVWRTLEDIGAGDGNDNTTYEFALNDDENGFIVTPLFNGQPIMEGEEGNKNQVKYEITLDVYTKEETDKAIADAVKEVADDVKDLTDAIGVPSKPESAEGAEDGVEATGLHAKIETETARAIAAEEALEGKIDAIHIPEYAVTKETDKEIYHLTKDNNNVDVAIDLTAFAKTADLDPYAKTEDLVDYTVSVTTENPEDSAFKHYVFSQCGSEIAHIDIPKDLVVESGRVEVKAEAGAWGEAGTYIVLEIANQDEPVYVDAKDLIDIYTVADTNTVDMTITGTEIKADVKISAVEGNTLEAKEDGLYVNVPERPTVEGKDAIAVEVAEGTVDYEVSLKLDPAETNVVLTQSENGLKADLADDIEISGTVKAGALNIDNGKVVIDADGTHMITYNGAGSEVASGYYGNGGLHLEGYSSGYTVDLDYNKLELHNQMSSGKYVKISSDEIAIGSGDYLGIENDEKHLFRVHEESGVAKLQLGDTVVTETELAKLNTELATAQALADHETTAAQTYATKEELAGHEELAAQTYATKEALAEHAQEAAETYATISDLEALEGELGDFETEVGNTYATKEELEKHASDAEAALEETLTNYYTKSETYAKTETYTKAEIDKFLDDVTGGSTESAASVKRALDAYIKDTDTEIYGAETVASWTDGTEYNPQYTAASSRIDANAQNIGNNATAIAQLQLEIHGKPAGEGTEAVVGLAQKVAALETELRVDTDARLDSLEGTVGDAESGLVKVVAGHSTVLETLTTETIPAIQQSVTDEENRAKAAEKANADAIAVIYTPEKGEVAASGMLIDEISARIAGENANKAAIEAIYKAGEGEAAATGLLAEEITRATGAEAGLSVRIDAIDALLNTISDADGINTLKELAIWVEEHDTEVLPIVEAHETILAGFGGEEEPATVKKYIDDSIEAIPEYVLPAATVAALGGIKSAEDVEGKATANSVYVDTEGKATVKAVTTDILTNGAEEFVLNGGNASTGKKA